MKPTRVPAERGRDVAFTFNDEPIESFEGETVAAALLAHGITEFGRTREGDPRAPLCNMGTCFDCAVTIDGKRLMRACLTDVAEGLNVTTHEAS